MTADLEYARLCDAVQSLTSLDLRQYKRTQMERRIRSYAQRVGAATLDALVARLGRDSELRDAFLDHLTINVSEMFRNPQQWQALRHKVLPELATTGRVRAWSAGCSNGAEAYSLAIPLTADLPGVHISVHGTDIDAGILGAARAARFDDEDVREVPPDLARRFLIREGNGWVVSPEIRKLVTFGHRDLLQDRVRPGSYDLVLCRNVVIYFNDGARQLVHDNLASATRAGGFLLVGSAERVAPQGVAASFRAIAPFLYRREELNDHRARASSRREQSPLHAV